MKTIFLVPAFLCFAINSFGQYVNVTDFRKTKQPLYVDSWLKQNIPLGKVINYKDSTIKLSDFKDKLIILDFWFTHCTSCIAQFPKEDALQKQYGKNIQFILVTFDSAKQVKDFFAKWRARTGIQLPFPMVVSDTALGRAFYHSYDPHYVWIMPDGQIVAQSAEQFVTAENIQGMIKEIAKRNALYEKLNAHRKHRSPTTATN